MPPDAWTATGVIGLVFVLLASTRIPPYLLLFGGVILLLAVGILTPEAALAGFSNEGMITVAALFVVSTGLNETGAIAAVVQRMLGRPNSTRKAQARLVLPVCLGSAFLNNTPIVAMLIPVVGEWSKRIRVPASQLLIPLSYAAILGGLCTLIGTSTNLVVHGLLIDAGFDGLRLFDITSVGVPVALGGGLFLLIFGQFLLPKHADALRTLEDPREYTIEMVVEDDGPLVGRTLHDSGMRELPAGYLFEVHRGDQIIPARRGDERLRGGDQLVFLAVVDSVMELQQTPGLRPASAQLFKLNVPRAFRCFVEAVMAHTNPGVGKTVKEGQFRNRYNAVVIGVARNGHRIDQRIGDIVLDPGDVLLLEASPSFVEDYRNAPDFYLVSRIEGAAPLRRERANTALLILLGMIGTASLGVLSMLQASLLAAGAMVATGCCSEETARRKIDWQLLISIAASFGLGHALESSGAADALAHSMLGLPSSSPVVALGAIAAVTTLLSSLVTNNASAVIMFPIGVAVAQELGLDPMPFVIAIMLSASTAFATPIGYQTNLMVYGAGGYRFLDFLRIGLPLNAVTLLVMLVVIPMAWGF